MGEESSPQCPSTPLVAHGENAPCLELLQQLAAEGLACRIIARPADLANPAPAVVMLDAVLLANIEFGTWRKYAPEAIFVAPLGVDVPADLLLDPAASSAASAKMLRLACQQWVLKRSNRELRRQRERADLSLERLAGIGIALSSERSPHALLGKILAEAQDLVGCDAASLYLVDRSSEVPELVFKLTCNDSVDFPFEERRFPISDGSIAGYVTNHGCELNIPDVYAIAKDSPFRFNYDFDDQTGYRSVSMLAMPMRNHRREVVGVLQFINRKRDRKIRLTSPEIATRETRPFDESAARLLRALASQSAIAIENFVLVESINRLFEGFVQASVAAIEQRDPTTSGHSFRVADLCVGLARELPRSEYTEFRHVNFKERELRELRFAALLHDFGKVGVREKVLIKARKLYDWELKELKMRLALSRERLQRQSAEALLAARATGSWNQDFDEQTRHGLNAELKRLDDFLKAILQANEPTILPEEGLGYLKEIHEYPFAGIDSEDPVTLLSSEEFRALSIPKGSLSQAERREIESHVVHTVAFLNLIPWTPELRRIPGIAGAHHEKLDGSGYPHRKKGRDAIPLPSRIMTICDIYDALTASDRPYKPAVPVNVAYRILEQEAKAGLLDQLAVKVFIDAKVNSTIEGKNYPRSPQGDQQTFHHHPCDFDLHRGFDDDSDELLGGTT